MTNIYRVKIMAYSFNSNGARDYVNKPVHLSYQHANSPQEAFSCALDTVKFSDIPEGRLNIDAQIRFVTREGD